MVAKGGKKKRSLRARLLLALAFSLAAGLGLLSYAFSNLNSILIRMAEARASQLAVEVINQSVSEVMGSGASYSDLIHVITDERGSVTMLTANTMLMNQLASDAALLAQHNLGELVEQGISLPLGSALGIGIFSGSGPSIRVRIVPVGSVSTSFVSSVESAGINQVRHEISLKASVTMRIVIPTGSSPVNVNRTVSIAESIIVGQVPTTFVNVPSVEDALNLLP